MVALVFSEPGKEYPQLPLRRANAIKDNIFELEVSTPNVNERNKSLFISIKYVSMEQDKSFHVATGCNRTQDRHLRENRPLKKGIQTGGK